MTFHSWTTDRMTGITGLDYQLHIGSSLDINSQQLLISAHRTEARKGVPKKQTK